MASAAQWFEGSRPRTYPNAIAPVIAGTGAAGWVGDIVWWKAALALVVALALIIGVNFANDYSDGIRGTDDVRVGPMRLVGSKVATPKSVKTAAMMALAVAGIAGLVLALTSAWWLILVGLACIVAAWYYTGGRNPYGYSGFGEISVFVFFGLVAVLGTQFVQAEKIDWVGLLAAVAVGCYSSGVLVANNLRDIPTDTESGKVTLAVRLGDKRTRSAAHGARGHSDAGHPGVDRGDAVGVARFDRGPAGLQGQCAGSGRCRWTGIDSSAWPDRTGDAPLVDRHRRRPARRLTPHPDDVPFWRCPPGLLLARRAHYRLAGGLQNGLT